MNKTFDRVFVTGDIHGNMADLRERVDGIPNCSKNDLLIIVGDCAFFYDVFHGNIERDFDRQKYAAKLPVTILCIQGNHEQPFSEMSATSVELLGGTGFESNGIYFAQNGTTLNINGKKCLVVGGAYSVDKKYRRAYGYAWWENEELSQAELDDIFNNVKGKHFDFVLTHTCPFDFLPREVFLSGIDQSQIKNRTEHALQKIHDAITFQHWYCGHFHTDKTDGKIEFLYQTCKRMV